MAATLSSVEVVRVDDPLSFTERGAIAGFLAGYTGNTLVSYTTDLRLFAEWCTNNDLRLIDVRRAHLEIFGRSMEADGRMRSTVARRLSTLGSFYRYCHVEGILERNPAANVRRPKVDVESRTLGLDRNSQEAASHADPRTTMRYDRARQSLDRHGTYIVAAFLAGAARSA